MNLQKFFYSVRYTRISQLFARVQLLIKRRFIERFSSFFNNLFFKKRITPKVNQFFAKPIFNLRKGKFKEIDKSSNKFSLTFLNESRRYQLPVNWHEKDLEYGTRLWKLNLHYMEFLEGVDNEWFKWIISDWIEQNPPYKKGYWLDSWNSFALSIRVVIWMQQIAMRKENLSTDFLHKTYISLYKQLLFLERNIEKDIRGNHIIKNIKALLWGATFFQNDSNIKRWKKIGIHLLQKEVDKQVLSDGMHYERSPSYHIQVFSDLLECYHILDNIKIRGFLEEKLHLMAQVVADLKHPDGRVVLFNDGGLNMAYKPQEVLDLYTKILGGKISQNQIFQYPEAGYFGMNNEDNYVVYDCGKIGPDELPGHGHGDIFSFEWSVGGKRIIVDKGVYEYNQGLKREASRSTVSHNTVNIDHNDQCEFWKEFRVARRANVYMEHFDCSYNNFSIRALHDGYKRLKGNPVHIREFSAHSNQIHIKDIIQNGTGHLIESRLLFHPNCSFVNDNNLLRVENGDVNIEIITDNNYVLVDDVWFPDFGKEVKTKQLIITDLSGNQETILKRI